MTAPRAPAPTCPQYAPRYAIVSRFSLSLRFTGRSRHASTSAGWVRPPAVSTKAQFDPTLVSFAEEVPVSTIRCSAPLSWSLGMYRRLARPANHYALEILRTRNASPGGDTIFATIAPTNRP